MFNNRLSIRYKINQELTKLTIVFFVLVFCVRTCLGQDKTAKIEAGQYIPPVSNFFVSPDETVKNLTLSSMTATEANRLIADARNQSPDVVLLLKLDGTLQIEDIPLCLPSRTSLLLGSNAAIIAGKTATAESLIEINDAEYIRITAEKEPARLDGNGVVSTGIRVRNSGKIIFDHIEFTQFTNAGIDYRGRGQDRFSDAGVVTRCQISDCAKGIVVRSSCQFVCLENTFEKCSIVGLELDSAGALISTNNFVENQIGSELTILDGAVTQNHFNKNVIGCRLGTGSEISLIWNNQFTKNKIGLDLDGKSNILFDNKLDNSRNIIPGGIENQLIANENRAALEVTNRDPLYFNPPTLSNPHKDEVIFNGKKRFDINFFDGGKLSDVQDALDNARKDHPDAVIVAQMKGLFTADGPGPSGLALPDFTCVILDGEIQSNNDQLREVVNLGGNGCASFSGGIIDCNSKGLDGKRSGYAINAPGDNLALIDAVTIRNSYKDSIMTQHHDRRDRSVVIRNCTIENSGRRGIWGHVSKNVVILHCTVKNSKLDGIDIDAHCMHAKVFENRCFGNDRHGVFLEEAVKGAIVFGNTLAENSRGIHVWNEEVTGNTGPNVIACNLLEKNKRGFSVGGRADDRTAQNNFFFNNVCRLNDQGLAVMKYADQNYFCDNMLSKNGEGFLDWTGNSGSIWWLGRPCKKY